MKLSLFLSLIFVGAACTNMEALRQDIVTNQAAYDFDCPSEKIKVASIGNHNFTAEGCFKREVYKCAHNLIQSPDSVECKQVVAPLPGSEGEVK